MLFTMLYMYCTFAVSAFVAVSLGSGDHYNTSGATSLADSQTLYHPFPYHFPRRNASTAELFAMPPCNGVKIEDATIDELQSYMADGKLTSKQLVTCYIDRNFQTADYIQQVVTWLISKRLLANRRCEAQSSR